MAWLYIQYQSLLYSEIIRIVQSSTDAEDVLHTVIEKLIDKVGFLRKLDRRGLVNYIITAAKNTAYNYCRDKKKELDFDFEQEVIVDNYDSLEDDIIKRENLFCLDQVWNSLDSKTQYLLSAKYLLNKSGKEIDFLIRSTYHYYVKRLQKERDRKVPEVYFEDLTPSQSNLVLVQTAVELEESISGYFPSSGLSEREIFILMAVYTYGYSVSDIAKYLQVSRQNINQIKKRAENKIRQKLT